jgi:hypothetical protein
MNSTSKFAHLKKKPKADEAATAQFIQGAVDRMEGTPETQEDKPQKAAKQKFLLSLEAADNTLIIQLSNVPSDFKCSKAAVVVAAVRAFAELSDEEKIERLRSV